MSGSGMRMEKPSPQAATEMYEGWRKAYEESYGRLLRAPAMGYYREAAEKLRHAVDSITEFNIILSEFYASLQGTGARSFEKLQEKLASMQAEGKAEPISFRDLYRLWWETSEELYIELFRTEEFSKLQGQLVNKGMQFRRDFQAYVEEATKELPFPNRSEMDHLYKSVDRLKREVRSLKKELKDLKGAGGEG
jgi:class III poly(R)-hydroxyalkanoic acid synthase PhaE subunit